MGIHDGLKKKEKKRGAPAEVGNKYMHPSIPQSALHSHSYSERAETLRFSVFDLPKRTVEDGEKEERNSLWWVMTHLTVSVGGGGVGWACVWYTACRG